MNYYKSYIPNPIYMALHYRFRFLLWMMSIQKRPPMEEMSPQEARDFNLETSNRMKKMVDFKPVEMFKITNRHVKTPDFDIPIRIYQPIEGEKLPILMFFHGGGFVIGNLDTHDLICRRLAALVKCLVVSVDYRLAPEHKFPAAPNDCYAATVWAYEHADEIKGDQTRIAVCGDSAGGNLATVISMMARDQGGPKITYQVLIYPTTDGTQSSPSVDQMGEGFILTKKLMVWFLNHYKDNQTEIKDPYFSPLFAEDLSNLPPALIITAEYDPLKDEGKKYAERLRESGVPVIFKEFKGMVHVFFAMPKFLKKARQAQELVAKELRTAFGTDGLVL